MGINNYTQQNMQYVQPVKKSPKKKRIVVEENYTDSEDSIDVTSRGNHNEQYSIVNSFVKNQKNIAMENMM